MVEGITELTDDRVSLRWRHNMLKRIRQRSRVPLPLGGVIVRSLAHLLG